VQLGFHSPAALINFNAAFLKRKSFFKERADQAASRRSAADQGLPDRRGPDRRRVFKGRLKTDVKKEVKKS
jgi:hypothetical protein